MIDQNIEFANLIILNYDQAIDAIHIIPPDEEESVDKRERLQTLAPIPDGIIENINRNNINLKHLTLFNSTVSQQEYFNINWFTNFIGNSGIKKILSILNFSNSNNLYSIMNPQIMEDESIDSMFPPSNHDMIPTYITQEIEVLLKLIHELATLFNSNNIEDDVEDDVEDDIEDDMEDHMAEDDIEDDMTDLIKNIWEKFNKLFKALHIYKISSQVGNPDFELPHYIPYRIFDIATQEEKMIPFYLNNFYLGYLCLYDSTTFLFDALPLLYYGIKQVKLITKFLLYFLYGNFEINEDILVRLMPYQVHHAAAAAPANIWDRHEIGPGHVLDEIEAPPVTATGPIGETPTSASDIYSLLSPRPEVDALAAFTSASSGPPRVAFRKKQEIKPSIQRSNTYTPPTGSISYAKTPSSLANKVLRSGISKKPARSASSSSVLQKQPNVKFGGLKGGACGDILYKKLLLAIKLLYELMHDLGPHSTRAQKATVADPSFHSTAATGAFQQIKEIWETVVVYYNGMKDAEPFDHNNDVDINIFEKLNRASKKTEDVYMDSVISALIDDCSNISDNFFYTPLRLYTFKSDDAAEYAAFNAQIQQYFPNSIMFVKESDSKRDIHLYITYDTLPDLDDSITDSNVEFNMKDMSIDNILKCIVFNKLTSYGLYKDISDPVAAAAGAASNLRNDLNMFFTGDGINQAYSSSFTQILNNVSSATSGEINTGIFGAGRSVTLVTPARALDPINNTPFENPATYKTLSADGISIQSLHLGYPGGIIDATMPNITAMNMAVCEATLYGINQLVNFWMTPDSQIIATYRFTLGYDGIIFYTDAAATQVAFQLNIRDTTVDSICKLLIKINKNEALSPDERRLETAANFIMRQPNFILPIPDATRGKKIRMTIISFFKFCGDEFQRLTCDYLNRNTLFRDKIVLITRDRVLVGASLTWYTPVLANNQSPHDAFYIYTSDKNIPGISGLNTGILSNINHKLNVPEPIIRRLRKTYIKLQKIINDIVSKSGTYLGTGMPIDPRVILNTLIGIDITSTATEINAAVAVSSTVLNGDPSDIGFIQDINTQYNAIYIFRTMEEVEILLKYLNITLQKSTVLLFCLEYYIQPNTVDIVALIQTFIDYEISKAVSDTFDTTTIDNIKISGSIRQFDSQASLKLALNSNIGDDSLVIKLLTVHRKACDYVIEKLNNHINRLQTLGPMISFFYLDEDNIEKLYNTYKDNIEGKKIQYDEDFKEEIQLHIEKVSKLRRPQVSYVDTGPLEEKIAILQQAQQEQQAAIQQAQQAAAAAALPVSAKGKPKKSGPFEQRIKQLETKYNKLTTQLELFVKKKVAVVKKFTLEEYSKLLSIMTSIPKPKGGNKKTRINRKSKNKNNTKNKNKIKKNKASKMNTRRQNKRKIYVLSKKRSNKQTKTN
jgi:hypothetical protein